MATNSGLDESGLHSTFVLGIRLNLTGHAVTRVSTATKAVALSAPLSSPRKEDIFARKKSSLPEKTSEGVLAANALRMDHYLRTTFNLDKSHGLTLDSLQDPLPVLISLAIHGSSHQRLTLDQLLDALADRFDWFRTLQQSPTLKVIHATILVSRIN